MAAPWTELRVARDRTHHLRGGSPAYDQRFTEVLAFHAPGLAPVCFGGEAWHIRADGSPVYAIRFARTFGFYENLAVVVSHDGWQHIEPTGNSAYNERYDWCGNFQEGRCAVRDSTGHYVHITARGAPAYPQRWRYAGDYRDGASVVQAGDGLSTHIDVNGQVMHGRWYRDLDVFHKGFARARDKDGWMHIDALGKPIYERRFAAVEPFYNGQARVERVDGGLEVIDESGKAIVELRPECFAL